MARIRTIKPEFFLHEDLYDLEAETGLPVRIAFAGLWCHADRRGRFKWRPRTLKAGILPHDLIEFSRVLDALTTRGFVVRYASPDGEIGWIPTFEEHQIVNNRESESELPEPPASVVEAWTSTRAPRVRDASPTRSQSRKAEGKGREGKGKEGKGKETGADDFSPESSDESVTQSDDVTIPSQLALPPFEAAWTEWLAYRSERRLSSRPRTLRAQLESLAPLGPVAAAECVRVSIRNGWQGIFPEKANGNNRGGASRANDSATRDAAGGVAGGTRTRGI